MTNCLKERTRRNCSFQCIGACVKGVEAGGGGGGGIKPKIPLCSEYGYFLEQHIAYQVYWLDCIKHFILYSYLKEDLVRQVLEEMKILFEQNQKEV